ncbi:MAG: hypothetical protein B7Z55_01565 [Planctomycetales bacterium 12-60-4]|nr:MAG: hypothetical protein B7Z55_01565 [Planctomycetales bacterium 12-60-4]
MLQRICLWSRARQWSAVASLGLAASCSACAALPGTMADSSPEMSPPSTLATRAPQPGWANDRSPQPAGSVRLGRRPTSDIQLMAYQEPTISCPPEAITSCPPEPRFPVAGPNPYGVGMPICDVACQPSPHHYPDEYICDGGDRELPVHLHEEYRLGLDTEDTVAEFSDHHGKLGQTASNRVCVYAPRFASVRSVSLPYEDGTFREVAGVDHSGMGGKVRTRLAPNLGNRNLAASGMRMRSRASGLESEQLPTDAQQRQRPQVYDKILNTFQDVNFFHNGTLGQSDVARLNLGIGAALVWSREQTPIIQGKTEVAITGLSEIHATALTVIEENDDPGVLRIVKVADKKTAEIGEIITFTIRYDNLGPNPVSQVRIIDNLTPRLEYVEDSATCDVAGRLVVQDNGEGSLILIWELAEPVAPKTGGVVTFQAKLR